MDTKKIQLPLLALRGLTIFPDMIIHFDVNRTKSINALEKSMVEDQLIFLIAQKEAQVDEPNPEDLYNVGTIARIKQLIKLPKNIVRVLVEGIERGTISDLIQEDPYFLVEVNQGTENDSMENNIEEEALIRTAHELIEGYSQINTKIGQDTLLQLLGTKEIGKLADQIAINIFSTSENKQRILDELEPKDRLKVAMAILDNEIEINKIKNNIQSQVKEKIDKNQKEYYLREQLKVIQDELGDRQGLEEEIIKYKEALDQLKAPKEVKEKINKEISRLNKMPSGSSESVVIRNYIETLLELPWDKTTKEMKDILKAEEILDEDHYGLESVKERVLEFLSVRNLSSETSSPILCLVGPPGTGKTSIARSVARALNRKYVRISLGGVRDEAEIRGHRRTYVGALPGRLITGLKQAGSKNPLMLLDEIDKMSNDFRGDPSAALLEVLDEEQNNKFRDHYLEVPVDLSNVLFIATANTVQTIPRPLLDRVEIIEVNSYTENEKEHIAKKHLIPKQLKKHGLENRDITISKNALSKVIREYTRESGVRTLERKIGQLCRKIAKEILTSDKGNIKVTEQNLEKYLGIPLYTYESKLDADDIGIARGLAWTQFGGDTLSIEVNIMPGNGKIDLTGKLGDVMKESAKAGISFIRSKSKELNINENFYKEMDIHIHIPEGAVPKDGPSAGITMATALISALTEKPVKANMAMTGEITLRGRVLPVGGLKEKILAAKRAGIEKVLLPKKNEKVVSEISKEIKKGIEIVFVENMDEVLKHAIG
ncbi:ATP-dependent Lon protease [Natranaerovirga pectinivora]|uniref:Lon protease n=1 Tax=Natranaerovirga pectinivora TaxID=682400 RepID=A0A4R3MN72_9FIRM|nr:endopeptidase La [Natranaerovirga pectinivora]TCT14652.1 ATP-dependent Lon protease [Natranaerovirga pectinivora]